MSAFPPIGDLILHERGMLLLDAVVDDHDETVTSETIFQADNLFFQRGLGVPAYVGFELMAQTISAYDGLRRRRNGKKPAIGLLLGCRVYASAKPYFAAGEHVFTEVTSLMGEEGMASFTCRIQDEAGGELASAIINVYRPVD